MNSFLREKLEKFRDRLLDITTRNRMINSNFSAKSKQYFRFIDELPNQLLNQLQNKSMSFKEIPIETREIKDEETTEFKQEYDRQKIINEKYLSSIKEIELQNDEDIDQKTEDARRELKDYVRSILKLPESTFERLTIKEAAEKNNINPSWELPNETSDTKDELKHQDSFIQTLMFKEELNTYLKNIKRGYKTSIAETGINPLYICLGFLEWREKDSSDRLLRSPLLMVQVEIDESKNKNNYSIKMTDAPISMNQTLNEKLKNNFDIELPEVNSEDEDNFNVEKYFYKVQNIVKTRQWNVTRVGTFGIYNAHHMPIYKDINNILNSENVSQLLERVLIGSDKEVGSDNAAVYDIDRKEEEDKTLPPLVCEADVSQHSAVVDALSGKSLVIKGPPGTGKSQTITNIIAALMRKGNKVLFVAQKQAALDVVRNRLEAVGLESYIMESFSAKLNKKSILESLQKRLQKAKPSIYGSDVVGKTKKYRETKKSLNQYSKIMDSKYALTETKVHDLIWDINNIDDEFDTKGMEELLRFNTSEITNAELDEDINSIIYLRETYENIFNKENQIRSHLLEITKVPDNPFDREDLSGKLNSLDNEFDRFDALTSDIDKTFGSLHILSTIEHDEIMKKIISSEDIDGSDEWKLLNLFLNETSKAEIDTIRGIYNEKTKLEKDLEAFSKTIINHKKINYHSIINTSEQDISDAQNAIKNSGYIKPLIYTVGLGFLIKDYKKARDKYKSLSKNTDLFENKHSLLEEIRLLRSQYDSRTNAVKKEADILENKISDLCTADTKLILYFDCIFQDEVYGKYLFTKKLLNNDEIDNLYNNVENMHKLQEYQIFRTSIEENILECSDTLGIDHSKPFATKTSILRSLNKSSISLDTINNYLNDISEEKNKRFKEFFLASIHIDEIKNDEIEKYYKNIIRKTQYRSLYKQFPGLNKYNESKISKLREDLKLFDKELTKSAIAMYGNQIHSEADNAPSGISSGRVKEKTELGLLNHITSKTKTTITLRHMFKQAFNAVMAYKPCTMMSPLTVSQLIPLTSDSFDTVIIDEASQMKPEYAIGAIARTKQVIIVGDQKQLPPAREFEARFNDEDDDDDIFDESILDMALTVLYPPRELLFHYRSRHQDLIKFSNAKFYQNLLIPMTASLNRDDRGLKHIYLEDACYVTGNTGHGGTNFIEAERVIDEAVNIMKTRPNESLGIATMNKKQADYLEDLMEKRRSEDKDVQSYIKKWSDGDSKVDQFFVKNLANVQGDERDIIIVSTLFGPDKESGKVRQNFGPINVAGGQRRLNVLFTRAKNQLILITSLRSSDITFDENSIQEGRRIFKEYLAYAESDDREIQIGEVSGKEVESPFQQWAIDVIESIPGFKADWEIGVKGFSIDIGVKHEDYPYSYILAVETDGASYHSIKSARDRDKLRQEILESHGWVFHRIWSTDWIQNPVKTKERLVTVIKDRLKTLTSRIKNKDKDHRAVDKPQIERTAILKQRNPVVNKSASDLMSMKLDMITSEDKWSRITNENDIYRAYGHIYNNQIITFLVERFKSQNH